MKPNKLEIENEEQFRKEVSEMAITLKEKYLVETDDFSLRVAKALYLNGIHSWMLTDELYKRDLNLDEIIELLLLKEKDKQQKGSAISSEEENLKLYQIKRKDKKGGLFICLNCRKSKQ